ALVIPSVIAIGSLAAAGEGVRIHWKLVPLARVKLDEKVPLKWNVYQPEKTDKKKDPAIILVLLGRRYLALDIKSRIVYTVQLADLEAHGADFETDDPANQDRVLPSSDWMVRDIGTAQLVRVTLGDYGRTLEVQLPHRPDMRAFY
ncbi:MAG: hypothetical protein WBP79_14080, partial [Candidatus Acidiferrales bacterium]